VYNNILSGDDTIEGGAIKCNHKFLILSRLIKHNL